MGIIDDIFLVFGTIVQYFVPKNDVKKPIRKLGFGTTATFLAGCVVYAIYCGISKNWEYAFSIVIQLVIAVGIYEGLLVIVYKLLRKTMTSSSLVMLWMWLGFACFQTKGEFYDLIKSWELSSNIVMIILSIWALGVIVSIVIPVIGHNRLLTQLRQGEKGTPDDHILNIYQEEKALLAKKCDVEIKDYPVKISNSVSTPMAVGLIKPIIYLPKDNYSDEQIRMILRHELVHLINNDNDTKLLMAIVNSLIWFVPFKSIVTKLVSEDIELACDEFVIDRMKEGERKEYANLILVPSDKQNGFTTCLSAKAQCIKYRLERVMNPRANRKSIGVIINILAIALVVMMNKIILLL